MSLLESIEVALGSPMPAFALQDPFGEVHRPADVAGPEGTLVAITCNHCPYAKAIWPRFVELAAQARTLGVGVVAINPNLNPRYPDDSPEAMRRAIVDWHVSFPYVVDESQQVTRAFGAQCTPEFFLYDANDRLVYHGRFDDNWKEPEKVTREDLKDALEAMAAGREVDEVQHPALGCSIKWRDEG